MHRSFSAAVAALVLFAAALVAGPAPAAAHGTPYACNISGPNILTHWGCGKAWRNASGGISGYFQDRHSDGHCVRAYAGSAGGSSSSYLGQSCTTSPVFFSSTWGPRLTISIPGSSVSYTA